MSRAPAVAGLVEVQGHAVAGEVDQVNGAGAVDVRQPNAALIEAVRPVEVRRLVHRDLRAEAAVAEVGPVTDLAIADAHQVDQTIAVHVGREDRLRGVGEDEARTGLFVERLLHPQRGTEAFLGERCVPDERVVFGDQHVGVTIAVQVDEAQVGIARVAIQSGREGSERPPTFRRRRVHGSRVSGPP